ncbi:hypothetical protein AB0C98_42000 [Streptomyces sp. NPDC048558]|uniref:hypothetical protein n=1 Tax=Streptomyces sp. NPDC048558 TaxID=3155759 RepID=UPI003420A1BB
MRGWQKYKVRETSEAIVGAVTGPLAVPRTLLLGRYDAEGRFQYVGRTTALAQAAGAAVAGLLTTRRHGHPWTGWSFSAGWGSQEKLNVTLVEPELVVEVGVDVARDASGRWRRHHTACGINKAEYTAYMDGAAQASALLLDSPRPLTDTVPLAHLRHTGAFHPPQSYRYLPPQLLRQLVAGHEAADELLGWLTVPPAPTRTPHATPPQPAPVSRLARRPEPLRSAVLAAGAPLR